MQNNLVRLALLAAARRAQRLGNQAQEDSYRLAADQISRSIRQYLRDTDGSWLWTLNAETLVPDPAVLNHPMNKGFGGLNGILAMEADVCGLTPLSSGWEGLTPSLKTFERLFNTPKRKAMFEKYGIWTQFDDLWAGFLTSPSYGHCYAVQAMLLTDHLDMAGRAIDFLAEMTFQPLPGNRLDRESPYHFYERCYLPELLKVWHTPEVQDNPAVADWIRNGFDGEHFDQGCGALNLVNVAEPLKIARLIVGVDDSDPAQVRIIPRLPPHWEGYEVQHWPILTASGLVRASIRCWRKADGLQVEVETPPGQTLPVSILTNPSGG